MEEAMSKSRVRKVDGERWLGRPIAEGIYAVNWSPPGGEVECVCIGVYDHDMSPANASEERIVADLLRSMRRYEDDRISARKVQNVETMIGPIPFYRMTNTKPEWTGFYHSNKGKMVFVGFGVQGEDFRAEVLTRYMNKMVASGLLPK